MAAFPFKLKHSGSVPRLNEDPDLKLLLVVSFLVLVVGWSYRGSAIKLEYSLKLKIKHNDWLLADTCPQPIVVLYFEFENELNRPGCL